LNGAHAPKEQKLVSSLISNLFGKIKTQNRSGFKAESSRQFGVVSLSPYELRRIVAEMVD
jgi:hypothetical protein